MLERLRSAMPGWLAMVDRVTPAELLDQVLRETAYAVELAGPRRQQARENLKKLRGSSGAFRIAATPRSRGSQITSDQLALGDESNAVVDAIEAVNLADGARLERSRVSHRLRREPQSGNRRPARADPGDRRRQRHAVGCDRDFESDADEETAARDRDETRRLLYVAVTRRGTGYTVRRGQERGVQARPWEPWCRAAGLDAGPDRESAAS